MPSNLIFCKIEQTYRLMLAKEDIFTFFADRFNDFYLFLNLNKKNAVFILPMNF